MKSSKSNSLRTQQAIARFGKAARHPLCQAALDLWHLEAALLSYGKEAVSLKEVQNSARQGKKQARELLDLFYKQGKQKEAIKADELWHKIDEHSRKVQACYEANVELFNQWYQFLPPLVARFERVYDAATRAKDTGALKALPRVRKRFKEPKTSLGDSDRRTLEILKMLRDQIVKAAWAKGRAGAGYWERARGSDRALSDDVWQKRLAARDIQSRLVDAPGDKDAKEVRRLAKSLGIRLAEDKRGRPLKPPALKKQKPKQSRGRPRIGPEIDYYGNTDIAQGMMVRKGRGIVDRKTEFNIDQDEETFNREVSDLFREYQDYILQAKREQAEIEKELARLRKLRGTSPLPRNLDKPRKVEGQIKRRSPKFAEFMDWQPNMRRK